MTARNTVIAPAGAYVGAGVTYVASDGTLKAARILALADTQSVTVTNERDNKTVSPASAGNVHIAVSSLTGKVYNRYNVPVQITAPVETFDEDNDDNDDDYY